MSALITIGGIALPEPSRYFALTADIVDSGRNTEGYVIGSIVRQDVAKIEVGWRYLTVVQWAGVLSLFRTNFYNDVTFFCQTSGQFETRQMYISDRSAGMWRRHPKTLEIMGWTECSLGLVEV